MLQFLGIFFARTPDKFLRNTMNYFDNCSCSDAEISRNFVARTPDKFLRNTMNYFDNFSGSDAEISWHFVTPTPNKFLRNTTNYFDNFFPVPTLQFLYVRRDFTQSYITTPLLTVL